jgi:pimeloyl-ACP methyl ester carboxylesterase
VDLKGFGSAPHPDDDRYAPADQAELVVRMIRGLDLRGVTLVGHSLGGGVALLVALAFRDADADADRLRRLVIVAGAAYRQRLPPFVSLGRRPRLGRTILRLVGTRRLVRWVVRSIVHDPDAVTPAQVEGYAQPLDSSEARRTLIATAAQIVPPELDATTSRYAEIDVPLLALWGRHDRVVPLWVGERLVESVPGACLTVLEACGHLPAEERPEESLERVLAFVDRGCAGVSEAASPREPAPG